MAQITGGPHRGHAAGDTDIEKQASQLASDVKYKVKKQMSGATHMNPAQVSAAYQSQLAKSPASGAVKALAKKKLMGTHKPAVRKEEFDNGKELAVESVANALYKVFVEKKEEVDVEALKEAYSKVNKKGERLYHVIVTDKKTGNTYTRDATREKIAELRANPNISSVEMSERSLDSTKEKTKGANTASVKSGKGLDPVGKEDSDVNNDGKVDKTDKYLQHRRDVRGAAISKRKGVAEAFLGEVNDEEVNPDANETQIDVMKGKNSVKINPDVPGSGNKFQYQALQLSHYETEGPFIAEKALSQAQQKFMGMVLATKRGAKPMSSAVAKAAKGMSEKQAKDFAKTKHKGLPVHKEAAECGMDEKPKLKKSEGGASDAREIPTKTNLIKNKFRSMGLKMSYEPEGEQIDELTRLDKAQGKQSGGTQDPAVRLMKQKIRGMQGKPAGQQKKVPGQKPPAAGQYGSGVASPAQKVAKRRASAQAAQAFMSDTRGT